MSFLFTIILDKPTKTTPQQFTESGYIPSVGIEFLTQQNLTKIGT